MYFINDYVGFATSRIGRYYQTIDGGDTWEAHTDPAMMDLNDVYFVDSSHGFISGDDGFFMRTVNGGISWTSMNCSSEVYEMKFTDINTGYALASGFLTNGFLVKTTNAGSSWFPVGMDDIESYAFLDGNSVIGTGVTGRLLKSTNAGVTWSNYTSSVSYADFVDIHFPSTATGYAIGYMGEVVKTEDTGENWQLLPQGPFQRLNGVWFTSDTEGFVSGSSSLYATADGGITWSEQFFSGTSYHTIISIWFIDQYKGFLGCDGSGFFQTADGGNTWTKIEYMTGFHDAIWFTGSSTGYLAGSYGKIMKTSNAGAVPVITLEKPVAAYTLFPNPAMNEITLLMNHDITAFQPAKVTLYSAGGAIISSNVFSTPEIRLDISTLSPGIYILQINTAGKVETKKIVKI